MNIKLASLSRDSARHNGGDSRFRITEKNTKNGLQLLRRKTSTLCICGSDFKTLMLLAIAKLDSSNVSGGILNWLAEAGLLCSVNESLAQWKRYSTTESQMLENPL